MADRAERYRESVALIRHLWTDERVTFEGKHFAVHDQKIVIPAGAAGGSPVWMGAGVHRAGAVRLGDA